MLKIAGFPCLLSFSLHSFSLGSPLRLLYVLFPLFLFACFLLFLCLLTSILIWRLVHVAWPALLSFLKSYHLELSALYFLFFPPLLKVFFFFNFFLSSFITFFEFMFHSFFQMVAYMSSLVVRKLILPRISVYCGDSYC